MLESKKSLIVRVLSWSPYGNGAENKDYYQCADGNANEEKIWYMGRTQCFRANTAFSLYGTLKGSNANGCSKQTFINSFFTEYGTESFFNALQMAGRDRRRLQEGENDLSVSSYCSYTAPNDDTVLYNTDDHYYSEENAQDHHQLNYSSFTSYSTGCVNGKYVTQTFQGAFCHQENVVGTTDTLSDFNSYVSTNLDCVQIYDGSDNDGEGDEDYEAPADDDGEQQNDQGANIDDALDLLYYSYPCSVRQYPDECPDPYGLLHRYTNGLERASGVLKVPAAERDTLRFVSAVIMGLGVAMSFLACAVSCSYRGAARRSMQSDGLEKYNDDAKVPLPLARKLSDTAQRIASNISQTSSQVMTKIQEFAEEEEEVEDVIDKGSVSTATIEEEPENAYVAMEEAPTDTKTGPAIVEMTRIPSTQSKAGGSIRSQAPAGGSTRSDKPFDEPTPTRTPVVVPAPAPTLAKEASLKSEPVEEVLPPPKLAKEASLKSESAEQAFSTPVLAKEASLKSEPVDEVLPPAKLAKELSFTPEPVEEAVRAIVTVEDTMPASEPEPEPEPVRPRRWFEITRKKPLDTEAVAAATSAVRAFAELSRNKSAIPVQEEADFEMVESEDVEQETPESPVRRRGSNVLQRFRTSKSESPPKEAEPMARKTIITVEEDHAPSQPYGTDPVVVMEQRDRDIGTWGSKPSSSVSSKPSEEVYAVGSACFSAEWDHNVLANESSQEVVAPQESWATPEWGQKPSKSGSQASVAADPPQRALVDASSSSSSRSQTIEVLAPLPEPEPAKKKRYKRPALAKISKWVFGRRKQSKD